MAGLYKTFSKGFGVASGTHQRRMSVVIFVILFCVSLADGVVVVCRDVVHVDEIHSGLLYDVLAPYSVSIVAALDLPVRPFVSRRNADKNRNAALLAYIADEFAQIPSVGVDDFIFADVGHEMIFILVAGAFELCAIWRLGDRAHVIVTELDDYIVSRLDCVVDFVPEALVEECAGAASCPSCIDKSYLGRIEDGFEHAAPSPHAVGVGI